MIESFNIHRRNPGHWDVYQTRGARLFRIRGEPGEFLAMDERAAPYPVTEFKTLTACMSFITDQLMYEENPS